MEDVEVYWVDPKIISQIEAMHENVECANVTNGPVAHLS